MPRSRKLLLLAAALLAPSGVLAQEALVLTIKDHKFEPTELRVPADKAAAITVKNLDPTAEEFESKALKIEKVIAGKSEGTVRLRALKPGRYEFVGEFHEKTAKGVIIVE
jgi:hypothetical protein